MFVLTEIILSPNILNDAGNNNCYTSLIQYSEILIYMICFVRDCYPHVYEAKSTCKQEFTYPRTPLVNRFYPPTPLSTMLFQECIPRRVQAGLIRIAAWVSPCYDYLYLVARRRVIENRSKVTLL